MLMIEIGKLGEEGNDVVVDDQLVEDRRGVKRDGARPDYKGQADAAFRLFHLVAKRGVGWAARLCVAQRMAGTEGPVFSLTRPSWNVSRIGSLPLTAIACQPRSPYASHPALPADRTMNWPLTGQPDDIITAGRQAAITRLVGHCARDGRPASGDGRAVHSSSPDKSGSR